MFEIIQACKNNALIRKKHVRDKYSVNYILCDVNTVSMDWFASIQSFALKIMFFSGYKIIII